MTGRPTEVIAHLSRFLSTPLDALIAQRLALDPAEQALALFKGVVNDVPAYRRFLADHAVDPDRIDDVQAFRSLPLTTKPNYMQAYPLPQRCRSGRLDGCDRLAVSSGSTGTPTFWPRAMEHELDVALRFEQVFRHAFHADRHSTLAVVCFPMGNWVGGVYTTSCCWHLAQKGYPLTVATPGNKPDEILRVVRELGPHYRQTVLLGYPPFVKDVVDAGLAAGLNWADYRIKLVFAGEVFSEEWRELIAERIGSAAPCYDFASLYGTADGGVLGNETPQSIAIRCFFAQNPAAARELFGESRLPTLVQYDPISRYFEGVGGTLVVSGDNGVPLIRYHIADQGGILSHADMMTFLADHGARLEDFGLNSSKPGPTLPFAWVFGRADFTVSYYGANIYPENVTIGLEQPELKDSVTGKFVMQIRPDADGSEYLHIDVELAAAMTASGELAQQLARSIRTQLLRLNSEFANYVPEGKQLPLIELRRFGDPDHFPAGVKHRYTRR